MGGGFGWGGGLGGLGVGVGVLGVERLGLGVWLGLVAAGGLLGHRYHADDLGLGHA